MDTTNTNDNGAKMENDNRLTVRPNPNTPQELRALITRCMADKPDKTALSDLQVYVRAHPGALADCIGFAGLIQQALINKVVNQPTLAEAVLDEMTITRAGLGYDTAPTLERLLIENIENCALRLRWVEYQLSAHMSSNSSPGMIALWEKRLSITQARFLRAVETLAKVRKLAVPALQFNIAQDGGQQVNITGPR